MKYRKKSLIELVGRSECGGYIVQNEGQPNDRWTVPKEIFEATYETEDGGQLLPYTTAELVNGGAEFGFSLAIDLLKEGYKLARRGWNGTGMFAFYQKAYPNGIPINKNTAEATGIAEGTVCAFRPYLMLYTAQKDFAHWVPSGSDLLAEDWHVVQVESEHDSELARAGYSDNTSTERAYAGIKDVFYIQVHDANGKLVTTNKHGDTFPSVADLERSLRIATGVFGHGVEVKIDKRTAINYIDESTLEEVEAVTE